MSRGHEESRPPTETGQEICARNTARGRSRPRDGELHSRWRYLVRAAASFGARNFVISRALPVVTWFRVFWSSGGQRIASGSVEPRSRWRDETPEDKAGHGWGSHAPTTPPIEPHTCQCRPFHSLIGKPSKLQAHLDPLHGATPSGRVLAAFLPARARGHSLRSEPDRWRAVDLRTCNAAMRHTPMKEAQS